MQCNGCYYQDRKESVCLHGSPIFDIDDNCTDYVDDDFVKQIRAEAIEEYIAILKKELDFCKNYEDLVVKLAEQLKQG